MFEWIARRWCRGVHTRPMWPIHGQYICAQCLRQYPVAWDGAEAAAKTEKQRLILLRPTGVRRKKLEPELRGNEL